MNRIFHIKSREEWDRERAIALRAPSPLGLRPEPVPVSAIRRVSTIAGRGK